MLRSGAYGAAHLVGTTGYGYDDMGRDALDKVYAAAFEAEDAIVRMNLTSGTQAITTALFAVLRPGDKLLAVTGKPYDTLASVIGKEGESYGSLKEYGVKYDEVPLVDGKPNLSEIENRAKSARLVHIQRSRGYGDRKAFSVAEIGEIVAAAKRGKIQKILLEVNVSGEESKFGLSGWDALRETAEHALALCAR